MDAILDAIDRLRDAVERRDRAEARAILESLMVAIGSVATPILSPNPTR